MHCTLDVTCKLLAANPKDLALEHYELSLEIANSVLQDAFVCRSCRLLRNPFEGLPIGDYFRGMQAADTSASPNRSQRNWLLKLIVDAFVDPTPHNFAPID